MTRSYSFRNQNRRRGQALLLAVLVMIFAALISITFITVVAVNIGQTGREEERGKAYQAAQAGVTFANLQITEGIKGLRWRPEQEVESITPTPARLGPPPATNVFYWTPFDSAQGWAGYNGSCDAATDPCEGNFVKFPDPRSTNPSNDVPNYMVKVEKVAGGPNPADRDPDNQDNTKTGMLRITSIGLSPDDPASFHKIVAYKAGPAQSPLTGAMRSVSNWDFQNGVVPSAVTATAGSSSATGTATMTLAGLNGSIANRSGFYITISDQAGGNARYAVVKSADAAGTTLTLAPTPTTALPAAGPKAPAVTWAAGERVELAAGLGAPLSLDFNNNAAADNINERVDFRLSKVAQPGSARINGGLAITGNSFLQYLRAPNQATATSPAGAVRVSGLVAVDPTSTPTVAGVLQDGTSTGDRTLVSSSGAFPFTGSEAPDQKMSVVDDGLHRITNSPDSTRQVQPFIPPDMTKGGSGFGRYRQMTKYSQPAVSTDPAQAGAYGYGQGIYINNPQDKEKLGLPTTPSREMTQAELEQLWFDPSASTAASDPPKAHLRAGAPRKADEPNVSLEQQHLRGWIAPDEFLPRGALVEINPDATLTITFDSIEDGAGTIPGTSERYDEGPVPNKSWRDANGDLINGTLGGVYSRKVAWPLNGVIFAEGNIRIRGKATTNPARNLTVVSMNNIYIEDSLGAADKKIVLLAKRNVVVNPTRVISRPQAQTRAGAGSSGTTIAVRNVELFREGDRIEIGSGSTYRRITAVNVAAKTITVNTAPGTIPTDGTTVIKLQADPTNSTSTTPFFNAQTPYLRAETQVMQRRFWLNGTPGAVRVAMRHGGAESTALSVQTTGTPPTLKLGNKLPAPPNTPPALLQVPSTEKNMTIEGDSKSPYPTTPATDTINQLVSQLNGSHTVLADGWAYNASALGSGGGGTYGNLPYRYLAGVGLRYQIDPATAPTPYASREDITATEKKFTMATAVRVSVNNSEAVLQLEDGSGGFQGVKQFGFSSIFGDVEDALTVDRSFYTTFAGSSLGTNTLFKYLTTDSRRIGNNLIADNINTLAWRFDETVTSAFSDSNGRRLPYYGLGRVKLENLTQYNSANAFETLDAGYTLDINAYVYAQEGSWLVIPGVYFDDRLKTNASGVSYIDLNNNGVADPGEGLDFNRDGVVSRDEQAGLFRYLRYNYGIKFTGVIMENKTALIEDPDGTGPLRGPVADWTDKWAKISTNSSNFSTTDASGVFNPGSMTTANGNFATIEYNYDPTAALQTLVTEDGFNPPISPELIYQTG